MGGDPSPGPHPGTVLLYENVKVEIRDDQIVVGIHTQHGPEKVIISQVTGKVE